MPQQPVRVDISSLTAQLVLALLLNYFPEIGLPLQEHRY